MYAVTAAPIAAVLTVTRRTGGVQQAPGTLGIATEREHQQQSDQKCGRQQAPRLKRSLSPVDLAFPAGRRLSLFQKRKPIN